MKKPIRALLFDLDGTLIDTGELHYQATIQALDEFGISIDRAIYDTHIHGNNNTDIVNFFFPDKDSKIQDAYVVAKEGLFRQLLKPTPPLAGLMHVLDWALQRDIPVGLVTNAPVENKDAMLAAMGLQDRFYPIILGDDLPRGKPDPLPFLVALEKLGVPPENAIGFDDSGHGIRAVVAANMYCVGVSTSLSGQQLAALGADLVIADFTARELQDILDDQ